jgi:hypothetical protein
MPEDESIVLLQFQIYSQSSSSQCHIPGVEEGNGIEKGFNGKKACAVPAKVISMLRIPVESLLLHHADGIGNDFLSAR